MSEYAPQHRTRAPIRLVVLFGGQSAEHDVSRTTAAHVLAAADPARYDIVPIGISRSGTWRLSSATLAAIERGDRTFGDQLDVDDDSRSEALVPTQLVAPVDTNQQTVVLPLLHGPMGEDGTVQGLLELADVAYVGDGVLASAVAMDKTMAKMVCSAAGIPQAKYRSLHETQIDDSTADELLDELGTPVFVKPANMGSSVGVSKAANVDELRDALALALSYDAWIVVEEAIVGREIELAVIGNIDPVVSVPGEVLPADEFYSYADKYIDGASSDQIPAHLSPAETDAVRQLALDVYRALRCEGLARCDFFFEEGGRGFLCNEVNTMPGFTPISMFPKLLIGSGWTYGQIIDRLVDLAIERHQRRRRNTQR